MKIEYLAQISSDGKLVNVYESPEQASIDDRNRFDPHEIRIALEAKITYKGYIWKWIYRDSDENANLDMEFRQELLNTLNALKEINEKLQCHTIQDNDQYQDGK